MKKFACVGDYCEQIELNFNTVHKSDVLFL